MEYLFPLPRRLSRKARAAVDRVRSEATSARVAKIAARGLRRPLLLTEDEILAVCASCLTQRERS